MEAAFGTGPPYTVGVEEEFQLVDPGSRALVPAVDQVIGQDHRECFIANHRPGAQYGMPQPQRLGLADVNAADMRRQDTAQDLEQGVAPARLEFGLQVVGLVEMILDRTLVERLPFQ